MPPKVRELIAELEKEGFTHRGGKGSHRNYVHPKVTKPISVVGKPRDDAKHYLVKAVRTAIAESKTGNTLPPFRDQLSCTLSAIFV